MKSPSSYHHPDLKSELLRASLKLLREDGLEGFTLRGLAQVAGVSHAAPYRHFRNKGEIIATLILEGHRLLRARLLASREALSPSNPESLFALGKAYLEFARENPVYLKLMFTQEAMTSAMLPHEPGIDFQETDSFGVLLETVQQCQANALLSPDQDSQALAIWIWSGVHGLALLQNAGMIAGLAAHGGRTENQLMGDIYRVMNSEYGGGKG